MIGPRRIRVDCINGQSAHDQRSRTAVAPIDAVVVAAIRATSERSAMLLPAIIKLPAVMNCQLSSEERNLLVRREIGGRPWNVPAAAQDAPRTRIRNSEHRREADPQE